MEDQYPHQTCESTTCDICIDEQIALLNYEMEYEEESYTANGYIYDGWGYDFDLFEE
jgi:hypothetical protein